MRDDGRRTIRRRVARLTCYLAEGTSPRTSHRDGRTVFRNRRSSVPNDTHACASDDASNDVTALHSRATHTRSKQPSSWIRTRSRARSHVVCRRRRRRRKARHGLRRVRRRHGRTNVASSRTWDGETRPFGRMEGRRGVLRALKLPSALRSASCAFAAGLSRTARRVGKRERVSQDRRIRSVARHWRRKSDVVVQAVDRRTQLRGSEPRGRGTRGDGTPTSVGSNRRSHVNRSSDVATSKIVVAHDVRCGTHTCERNVNRRHAFASCRSDVALGRANTREQETVFIATSIDERHVSSFLLVNQTAKTGMPKPKPSTAAMPSPNLSLRFVICTAKGIATTPSRTRVSSILPCESRRLDARTSGVGSPRRASVAFRTRFERASTRQHDAPFPARTCAPRVRSAGSASSRTERPRKDVVLVSPSRPSRPAFGRRAASFPRRCHVRQLHHEGFRARTSAPPRTGVPARNPRVAAAASRVTAGEAARRARNAAAYARVAIVA